MGKKKIVGADGRVYKVKKRGGCLKFIFMVIVIIAVASYSGLFNNDDTESPSGVDEKTTTVETLVSSLKTEDTSEIETEDSSEISADQLESINDGLRESLNEAHQFAINGDVDYNDHLTIDNLYFQDDGILVAEVNDDFFNLSEDERDTIANSVHGMGQLAKYYELNDEDILSESIYMSFRYYDEIIGNSKLIGSGIDWKK